MLVTYCVDCFERELKIIFPDGYEHLRTEIEQMLDDFYFEWHDVENIEDPEEQKWIQDSCLEEYMMFRLSETYNMWEEWTSVYYGDDPDEDYGEYWTKNEDKE